MLEATAQQAAPKPGDQIVTSGDGGLLPPGLPIGTVVASGNKFRVALFADSGTSQDVEIISYSAPREQPPAPSPQDVPVGPMSSASQDAPAAQSPAPANNGATVTAPVPRLSSARSDAALPADNGKR
jgi:rod shape-determining protein MreC